MISYQNTKIVPVSAWISGGVVKFENQTPSCFHFNAKTHSVHEIQTQQSPESKTGISRKSYFMFVLQVFPQKRQLQNCSLISIILSNSPQNVNHCYCCYQQRQQRRLAIMTSKCSKWNNSLGELSIIIQWEITAENVINRGYSNVWSEYDFYFIEWSEKNMYISWVPKARMKYTFFSLHEMK